MNLRAYALLSCAVLVAGCAESSVSSPGPGPAKSAPAVAFNAPAPKDAQWTIFCQTISGPDHVNRCRQLKAELQRTTGMRDWHVVHGSEHSSLYYGYYRAFNDPKDARESQRAQADRKRLDTMTDSGGNRPFRQAMFVELAAPDPVAPPEWNLANARGYWSLQIAAYKDSPERKKAAVEAVRAARAESVEAYYYHGESVSSVCIGAWPREAVAPPGSGGVGGGILDRKLAHAMRQYPIHSVNGLTMVQKVKDPKTGRISEVPDPSFLVAIPESSGTSLLGGEVVSAPPAAPPAAALASPAVEPPTPTDAPAPPPRVKPGVGKLKSIGD